MPKSFALLAAAALGLTAAAPLTAQTLTPGKWTGTVSPPSNQTMAVSFDVLGSGDSLSITMHGPEGRDIPFRAIRVESDTLHFEWSPGETTVRCALNRQEDGSFRGTCTDTEGKNGQLAMVPPPKS
jgi:hypothetical protein